MLKKVISTAVKSPVTITSTPSRAFTADPKQFDDIKAQDPRTPDYFMKLEWDYGCHNYQSVPVIISRAKGSEVWDVEGKKYLDFLSGFSVVNQGHCHPKILKAMVEQAEKLTLTSRAFYNDLLGPWEQHLTKTFGYQKALCMNTGVEAGESGVKLARRWAYRVKKVPENKAKVLFAKGNFWGRTLAACASSDDPYRYHQFGPFDMGFDLIDYGDANALEEALKADPNIAAYMLEPIQGEAGVVIPPDGYLRKVRELCTKYNVLMICDEVQTGLGRTGKLFAHQYDGIRPDILLLGKALSGGFYPVSAILADDEVMMTIQPGEHGSTYGGNPLACAIGKASLDVLFEENLIERSATLGEALRKGLRDLKKDFVIDVRGRGLLGALEIDPKAKFSAWDVCLKLKENGIITKTTKGNIIR